MKVLLATDGSKHAEQAAWFLAHLPHGEPLELTILAVQPLLEIHGSREVVEWYKRDAEAEKERAFEICQRIERVFDGADATMKTVVAQGHPGQTIVSEASARGIELIVMGAIGHSRLDRFMLGSVSDFVATHAHCSVLLVRPPDIDEPQRDDLSVCIAYDDSEPIRFALKQLAVFKWGNKTHLDVVNAIALPFSYSEIPVTIDTDAVKAEASRVVEGVAQDLVALSPNVQSHVIEVDHIGDGIVHFTKKHQSDLVVLGDTGHGLLGRFLMGSVSRFVLRHAECSVWLARRKPSS